MPRHLLAAVHATLLCLLTAGCSDSTTGPDRGPAVVSLHAGGFKTCALLVDGTAWCWGIALETFGAPLDPPIDSVPVHHAALDGSLDLAISDGSLPDFSYCWTDAAGATRCHGTWAPFDAGIAYPLSPLPLPGPLHGSGLHQSGGCGLVTTGEPWCWGSYYFARRGIHIPPAGDAATGATPNRAAGTLTFAQLAVGAFHACGRTSGGNVHCWGDGSLLGDSTEAVIADDVCLFANTCALEPIHVPGVASVTDIAANSWLTCAVTLGRLTCWTGYIALEDFLDWRPSMERVPEPQDVPMPFVPVDIEMTWYHACGLDATGKAWCWGKRGPWLGTPHLMDGVLEVDTDLRFTSLAVGDGRTCGISTDGEAWCWGENHLGQLGDGTTEDRYSPVRVRGLGD